MSMELDEFEAWPKIGRLRRDMVITEKLDGTNGQISIRPELTENDHSVYVHPQLDWEVVTDNGIYYIRAGSRNKWIAPGKQDNAGFAGWVRENADVLVELLGEGRHYGEWWGQGIQRRYDMEHKQFSLFNVGRWNDAMFYDSGVTINVVPTLYEGPFRTDSIKNVVDQLEYNGSVAAPGFMDPEGVIVFHTASQVSFKQTIKGDDAPKSVTKG